MKKKLSIIGIGLLFLMGIAMLFYPDISNWLAECNQSTAMQEYDESLAEKTAEDIKREWQKAKEYNDSLSGIEIKDPFIADSGIVLPKNYADILNLNTTMGYIEIPTINVSLPIYHGTSEEVLKNGVGHMEMTAFPIGGEGNHSVLTGHTGLPSAKLFTDLDNLKIGNKFYIHILNEIIAFEVDQILVVIPENTEALRPIKGEDHVTLITCTPYAINSHRLLVRGRRVPYVADEAEQIKIVEKSINWRVIIIALFIVISVLVFIVQKYMNRNKKTDSQRF